MRLKRVAAIVWAFGLAMGGNPAAAELLRNLRVGGQLDVQATSANNVTDFASNPDGASVNNDRIGDAQTRLMLHLDWDLLDDVHSRVTLRKNDRTYGSDGGQPKPLPAETNSQSLMPSGGTDVLGNIFLDEASIKIDKIAGQVDLTLGRQFFGEPNDLVIFYGPSDKAWYGMPVTAIDGARVDWLPLEWLGVSGLVAKRTGSNIGAVPQADTDVRGLNLRASFGDWLGMNLYGWNRLTHRVAAAGAPPSDTSAGGKNDNLYVLGYRFKVTGAGFWLKGEFDQNLGDRREQAADSSHSSAARYEGFAALGDVGWRGDSDDAGMLSLWGQGAILSGRQSTKANVDDGYQAIESDYRPGAIYGRFAAISSFGGIGASLPAGASDADTPLFARASNRIVFGGGVKASPGFANKATLALSYWGYRLHRFNRRPGTPDYAYRGNRAIGYELDAELSWAHSENVTLAAGWATFQPGGAIYEAKKAQARPAVSPIALVYFDTRVRF